jgi:hypothetical protein
MEGMRKTTEYLHMDSQLPSRASNPAPLEYSLQPLLELLGYCICVYAVKCFCVSERTKKIKYPPQFLEHDLQGCRNDVCLKV